MWALRDGSPTKVGGGRTRVKGECTRMDDAVPDISARCVCRVSSDTEGWMCVSTGPHEVLVGCVGLAGNGHGIRGHGESADVRYGEQIVRAGHGREVVQRNKTEQGEGSGPASPSFLTIYGAFGRTLGPSQIESERAAVDVCAADLELQV